MLPKYIKVENFASYINETLNFNEWGNIVALMGENGSGKSSILHMITTAVFYRCPGVDAKGSGMDELIHEGADSFKIEYCFTMNNIEYLIIREKSKKSQSLKLFIDGQDHTGKLSETQKKINDIIKMDYETFMDTVIIGQGESASFMKKSSNERKKIIAQILRLDKYDVLESYTKEIKKELKSDITITEMKINELYDFIKNKEQLQSSIVEYSNEIKLLDKSIEDKEKEYQVELEEKTKYKQLQKQQESIISRKNQIDMNLKNSQLEIEKYKKFEVEIKNVLSKKDETYKQINNINEQIENNDLELSKLRETKVIKETKSKMLNQTIDELKGKFIKLKNYDQCDCQFCGQNISTQYKTQYLNDIKQEGCKNQEELALITNELTQLEQKINTLVLNNRELKQRLNNLEMFKTKISQAEIKIESVQSKLLDLNTRVNELLNEQNELSQIEIVDIQNKVFNDEYIKFELNELRRKLTFNNTQIGIIENKLNDIAKYEIEYDNTKVKYDNMKDKLYVYEELQKAWGKNGIQAIIIDNILPQIEDEINKYLKILSDDKIFIKFITQKESKNGNKSETLEIIVSDSKGARSYERYSGGQRTRIDFACHIGMSKFLAKRSGANIDLFMVDEGIGTLDESGKQNFLDTVNLLSGIFEQVIVISHIPDIIEAFENKIIVTNNIFNGSKVNAIK